MKKTKEVDMIKLEMKTMAEKFKNIKEVKTGQNDHVSSGSGKGKVNIISEKVTEKDLMLTEKERIARENMEKELDELNALREKLDVEEAEARNLEIILENKKALFMAWTLDRMQKSTIDDPNIFWLEPKTSFQINKEVECQFDFPITPRRFLFRCF
ncbi:unnamed protein product [Lactuca virosa]|uniref:Uncharacterized protein n=1 Tax=Lactuca virosa TaxID=75947 RepID=A0AAU9M9K7_9ASTR|nr:unnamed protein product [Lactuca virosa]